MMNVRHLNTVFFFLILAAVTMSAYLLFAPFIGAIFVAAILAILFYPLYERCTTFLRGNVIAAASIMLLLVAMTIVLPVIGLSALVVGEVADVLQNVTMNKDTVQVLGEKVTAMANILPGLSSQLTINQESLSGIAQQTGKVMLTIVQKTYAGAVGGLLGIFVLFFTLFYFFVDGKRIVQKLMFLSPLSDRHERLLFHSFSAMSRATIKGTLLIGVIQGSLGAIALFIAGVPSVMIWWVLMVFLAIIPLVGVSVVGFPLALYYFIIGDAQAGLIILSSFTFITVIDNYLRPMIVGRDVQMHTLLVFFATLGGIISFGLIGFIVGPIVMALFVTLWQIYGIEFEKQLKKYNE